jgi:hypothetical protein
MRRNAVAPTHTNATATERTTLPWTAVASAADMQHASVAPVPQPRRSRKAPRGTANRAVEPTEAGHYADLRLAGRDAHASGAQVAAPPARPASPSTPRRSTRGVFAAVEPVC